MMEEEDSGRGFVRVVCRGGVCCNELPEEEVLSQPPEDENVALVVGIVCVAALCSGGNATTTTKIGRTYEAQVGRMIRQQMSALQCIGIDLRCVLRRCDMEERRP